MKFSRKYSQKIYNFLHPYIGKKIIISVDDFKEALQIDKMKTTASLIQKIVTPTKDEFNQNESLSFHFDVLKKHNKIEFFIFYPYLNESIIFQNNELNIESEIKIISHEIPKESEQNKITFPEIKIEENQESEKENFEFSNFENSQKKEEISENHSNQSEIEKALELMRKKRQNDI